MQLCFVTVLLFDLDGDGQIMTKDGPSLSQRCNIHDNLLDGVAYDVDRVYRNLSCTFGPLDCVLVWAGIELLIKRGILH